MREIKFRFWDKGSNQFVNDVLIDRLGNLYQTNRAEIYGEDRNIEVSMFTGLKDKHNREIYDGDIISDRKDGRRYWVKFFDGAFWACSEDETRCGGISLNYLIQSECFEVAGNVYESHPPQGVKK